MKTLLAIALVGFVFGCATPYQQNGSSGGYSDIKLNTDLYQVSFRGNEHTRSDLVQMYFLRRCAEITTENGYDYFTLVNQEFNADTFTPSTHQAGTLSPSYYGRVEYSSHSGPSSITKHTQIGIIRLFRSGSQPAVSIDAKEVLKHFKSTVVTSVSLKN